MTTALSLGAIETAVKGLFPDGVAVAVEEVTPGTDGHLWPEERAAIAGAVPKRLAEFAAGRSAARQALAKLGHPPAALPVGPDRAPLWPPGIAGSIAHAADIAIAVARRGSPLGIDIEEDSPLDPDLWPVICTKTELDQLPLQDRGLFVKHIFSAKEAIFKAQDPRHRAMFGFDAVSVTLAESGFHAKFCQDAGAFRNGQTVTGRLTRIHGLILAGAAR
ncbi:4'-phosphopantetheinyl transferase family protein [Tabrizicola sp.]|uniref:4'-phosphopantetheinyl transferase family protein n=1 Tax=Tabrizicola sp. TaxID=2005166 RepID=UPI003F31AA37